MDEKKTNPFQDVIQDIQGVQSRFTKLAEEADPQDPAQADKNSLAYLLYNEIMETTIRILASDTMTDVFRQVSEKMGTTVSQQLITAMSMAMTHSAYQAILYYDGMMQQRLSEIFEVYSRGYTTLAANVNGIMGALQSYKSRLEKLDPTPKTT